MKRNKKKYFAFGHVKNKFAHFGCRQQILRRCGGLVIRVLSSRSLVPRGFESRPGASPQCGLRGGRSYCNTVQKKVLFQIFFLAIALWSQRKAFTKKHIFTAHVNFWKWKLCRAAPRSQVAKFAIFKNRQKMCISTWMHNEMEPSWTLTFWILEYWSFTIICFIRASLLFISW